MPVLGAYKVRRDGREISQGNFKFHETHHLLFIKPFLISNTPPVSPPISSRILCLSDY